MTTFNWSLLTDGQVVTTFNPASDVLLFDDAAISAALVAITGDTDTVPPFVTLSYGGKTVTVEMNPLAATTTNVTFANGSKLLVGDNTTGTINDDAANTLTGSAGSDQFIGLGGADSFVGGGGNDVFTMFSGSSGIWGNDTISGGAGIDTLLFANVESDFAVNVNLATGVGTGGDGNPGSTLTLSGIENVIGNQFADTLIGSTAANRLEGQGGNDTLAGGPTTDTAADRLYGGDGDDVLRQTRGADTLDGGAGTKDRIEFTTGVAYGGAVGVSVNLATGVSDLDRSAAGPNSVLVGIEIVTGTSGDDLFTGGDTAHATDNLGNTIGETFSPRGGNDTVTGGSGNDFFAAVSYGSNTNLQPVTVNLGTGTASDGFDSDTVTGGVQPYTDTLVNVDMAIGGAAGDTLFGGSLSRSANGTYFEAFRGEGGNDTIDGSGNAPGPGTQTTDRLQYNNSEFAVVVNIGTNPISGNFYGTGIITVAGGTARDGFSASGGGTDTLIDLDYIQGSEHNDTLVGGNPLFDNFERFEGEGGNDSINGGSGTDEASYQNDPGAVTVRLNLGTAKDGYGGTDTLVSIEEARGSDFDDLLVGNAGNNRFVGDAGDDTINGGNGIDFASYRTTALASGGINATIAGGSGMVNDAYGGTDTLTNIEGLEGTHSNDTLTGGLGDQWLRGVGGSDSLNGGAGIDWASYRNSPGGVTANLATGTATDGWNADGLGLGGTDTLTGIENLEGSNFNDTLTGKAGVNNLSGLDGNDVLRGAAGNDMLTGGTGSDKFDFNTALNAVTNVDTISDFAGNDFIRLDDDIFTALATGALPVGQFHSGANVTTAGDADDYIIYDTTTGFLYYDADGNMGVSSAIQFATLTGAPTITQMDFSIIP